MPGRCVCHFRAEFLLPPEARAKSIRHTKPEAPVLVAVFTFVRWLLPWRKKNKLPCPKNSFPAIDPYPVERTEILKAIFRRFKQTPSLVLIGLGGTGKTQAALLYAEKYKKQYLCRWWVDASGEQGILEAYRHFAKKNLNMPDDRAPETYLEPVKDWMRTHEKWLFIFDNADDLADKQKYIPTDLSGRRHVLFTSREDRENWNGVAKPLEIDPFSLEEARTFLKQATGRGDDGSLDALIEAMQFLPLGLAQAAAYIRAHGKTYSWYVEEFEKNAPAMLQMYHDKSPKERVVYTTWNVSMQMIARKSARQLLNIIAFLAPDDIQVAWFVKAREALPEPLRAEMADALEWNDIILELTKHSLMRLEEGKLSIHRLVMEVVRDALRKERAYAEYEGYAQQFGRKLCIFDFPTRESRNEFENLYPHIEAIIRNSTTQDNNEQIADLCAFLGSGTDEVWGDYDNALEWYGKTLEIRENVLGKEHPDTATTYNNIAGVHYHKGDYASALEWYGKALKISENVLGKEHPNTAMTYNNIAAVYDHKGDYDSALEWHGKALEIYEKVLGKEHPNTATIYNNIALVHYHKGDYASALEWYGKALKICENVLGKEHPSTATTYNNIALVHYSKGDYASALEWYGKALEIREKVLGKEHPDTAKTYRNIALAYSNKGEHDRAFEYLEKALVVHEKNPGKEHPDTATTYNNFAVAHANKGDYALALKWHHKARNIREKVLGTEHPDTRKTYESIAACERKLKNR